GNVLRRLVQPRARRVPAPELVAREVRNVAAHVVRRDRLGRGPRRARVHRDRTARRRGLRPYVRRRAAGAPRQHQQRCDPVSRALTHFLSLSTATAWPLLPPLPVSAAGGGTQDNPAPRTAPPGRDLPSACGVEPPGPRPVDPAARNALSCCLHESYNRKPHRATTPRRPARAPGARGARWVGVRRAPRRRGVPRGLAPLAAPRLLRRVRRAPRLPAGRRPALHRLAHVRALGPALRQAVRRGNEPADVPARGRERVDGVVVVAGRAADEVVVRQAALGVPGAAPAPPGGRGGAYRVRRG